MIAQTAVDLIDMGNLALRQGKVALARWQYEESLVIWRALGDARGMAHALERLRMLEGNPPSSKELLRINFPVSTGLASAKTGTCFLTSPKHRR